MGRNNVGKGEIACYEQFLLFPQCFQKACCPGASKGVVVWKWVKIKPILETTCVKQPPVTVLMQNPFLIQLNRTCIKRPPVVRDQFYYFPWLSLNTGYTVFSILKLFPILALVFTCLWYKSFENTAGRGEIASNEQFFLFPLCFLLF